MVMVPKKELQGVWILLLHSVLSSLTITLLCCWNKALFYNVDRQFESYHLDYCKDAYYGKKLFCCVLGPETCMLLEGSLQKGPKQ